MVSVRHLAAVLPAGDDTSMSRGGSAIEAVMRGEGNLRRLDASDPTSVGNRMPDARSPDARIPLQVATQLSNSSYLAVLAGLDLLETAGLISEASGWTLPHKLRDGTGVIFTSSFEPHEVTLAQVRGAARAQELQRVRRALEHVPDVAPALDALEADIDADVRKVALQLLLGANVQLAQIVKARGLNTCTSNACASTTAALSIACSALRSGDVQRVVVVACDSLLQPNTREVVESFVRLKAASTCDSVAEAARPFSEGRGGFVLGDGAVALLLEADDSRDAADCDSCSPPAARVEIIASRIANSAYHGTRMEPAHLTKVLSACVQDTCRRRNLDLDAFTSQAVYVSHETFTPSCSNAEVDALESVFGRERLRHMPIVSVKGVTGHLMGAGMEDLVAVTLLREKRLPVVHIPQVAACFADLTFAAGEAHERTLAIHVAAGLGSHVAVVIYGTPPTST